MENILKWLHFKNILYFFHFVRLYLIKRLALFFLCLKPAALNSVTPAEVKFSKTCKIGYFCNPYKSGNELCERLNFKTHSEYIFNVIVYLYFFHQVCVDFK